MASAIESRASVSSEATDNTGATESESNVRSSRRLVVSPVLCYIEGMYGRRPSKVVQDMLCSFYTELELEKAKHQIISDISDISDNDKLLLELPNTVKAKHKQGPKKKATDASDLMVIYELLEKKMCLHALPAYCTTSIFRIPGEDPNVSDPKVWQSEATMLRQEMAKLSESIDEKFEALQKEIISRSNPVPPPRKKSPEKQHIVAKPETKDEVAIHSLAKERLGTVKGDGFLCFYGGKSPLSNFHPCKITIEGEDYLSSEQAFQYGRAKRAQEDNLAEKILLTTTPLDAKRIGDLVLPPTGQEETWNDSLAALMEEVCAKKFEQNNIAQRYLLKTKDLELVEATTDKVWGCGVHLMNTVVTDKTKWFGENRLGKILMAVRDRLRQKDWEQAELSPLRFDFFSESSNQPALWKTSATNPPKLNFANAAKAPGEWNLVQHLRKKNIKKMQGQREETTLKGVERTTTVVWRYLDFYVGQLHPSTSGDELRRFLEGEGITVQEMFPLASKVPQTVAFRVRCEAVMKDRFMAPELWPRHVTVRPWVRKPKVKSSFISHSDGSP